MAQACDPTTWEMETRRKDLRFKVVEVPVQHGLHEPWGRGRGDSGRVGGVLRQTEDSGQMCLFPPFISQSLL